MMAHFGSVIQAVGASWMMVALGGNAQQVALVSTMTLLPIMLFALLAGAVADNFDRRLIMLASQGFMLVMTAFLAIVAWSGALDPQWLLVFTFLIGCGSAFHIPSWQASVGDMVPRPLLPLAITYNSMGFNIARSLGPAIGGAIVAIAGGAAAFALNAISYTAPLFALSRWKSPKSVREVPPESIGEAMVAGIRYTLLSPNILIILVRGCVVGLAGSPVAALMPLVARDLIEGGPLTFGLLLGGFGAGAIAAALASRRLRTSLTSEWLLRGACIAMAIGSAACAVSSVLPISMLALSLTGAGWVLALSTFNASVQLSSPRWVLARTLAVYQTAAFGGMACGSSLCGWIAKTAGVETALLVTAAMLIAGGLLGLFLPMPHSQQIDLDPLNRWTVPDTCVPVTPRTGPVVIEIEYLIDPRDIPDFLRAMSERRRICTRDGASGWSLMRDLADPVRWMERYNLATWLDYIRYNRRRTRADDANGERLRQLHRGAVLSVRRGVEQQPGLHPLHAGLASDFIDPGTDAARSI